MRIENPLLALYRGTGYFSLARTFRTVWGGSGGDIDRDYCWAAAGVGADLDMRWWSGCFGVVWRLGL